MTPHILQGRSEKEVLWFQRRDAIKAAAVWTALGGLPMALAQQRSNIVELVGDVLLNGRRLRPEQTVQTGDDIFTGPGSRLVFMVGNAAFHVRQNSRLSVERGATLHTVSLLRLLTGAVASVFGSGSSRAIVTPTLTAGIRGTGVYTEVMPNQNGRSYFCNCYGTVEMAASGDRALSESTYHQAFWGEVEQNGGHFLTPAGAINHSDEEMEFLARLIGQQTAWQILGKKGVKDGRGFMQEMPADMHPAMSMPPR